MELATIDMPVDGGDLYAVVAVWDLTELERAVLAGRS